MVTSYIYIYIYVYARARTHTFFSMYAISCQLGLIIGGNPFPVVPLSSSPTTLSNTEVLVNMRVRVGPANCSTYIICTSTRILNMSRCGEGRVFLEWIDRSWAASFTADESSWFTVGYGEHSSLSFLFLFFEVNYTLLYLLILPVIIEFKNLFIFTRRHEILKTLSSTRKKVKRVQDGIRGKRKYTLYKFYFDIPRTNKFN